MTEREQTVEDRSGWEYLDLGLKVLETTEEATQLYDRLRQRIHTYAASLEDALRQLYGKTVQELGDAHALGRYAVQLHADILDGYPGLVIADSEQDGTGYFRSMLREDFYWLFVGERVPMETRDPKKDLIGIVYPTGHQDIAIRTNVDREGTLLPAHRSTLVDECIIGHRLIARELAALYEKRLGM